VRDGKAEKVDVRVGSENGVVTEILSGLRPDDEVVVHSKQALTGGALVAVTPAD
jgi:multidrug efflux pump subunit AcrA (membrane-fusion protein)